MDAAPPCQLLLTIGLVAAALIGLMQAQTVETATQAAQALPEAGRVAAIFTAKDQAWRSIFWVCLTPGIVFTVGALLLAESPRWLAQRGRIEQARQSLLRTRLPAAADIELREMQDTPENTAKASGKAKDPLLSRRYVLPFLLACLILACTQATGINSILAYSSYPNPLPVGRRQYGGRPAEVLNAVRRWWPDVSPQGRSTIDAGTAASSLLMAAACCSAAPKRIWPTAPRHRRKCNGQPGLAARRAALRPGRGGDGTPQH